MQVHSVPQVGVGSGIKCGVNIWRALRPVRDAHDAWAHRLSEEERVSVQATERVMRSRAKQVSWGNQVAGGAF